MNSVFWSTTVIVLLICTLIASGIDKDENEELFLHTLYRNNEYSSVFTMWDPFFNLSKTYQHIIVDQLLIFFPTVWYYRKARCFQISSNQNQFKQFSVCWYVYEIRTLLEPYQFLDNYAFSLLVLSCVYHQQVQVISTNTVKSITCKRGEPFNPAIIACTFSYIKTRLPRKKVIKIKSYDVFRYILLLVDYILIILLIEAPV